MDNATTLVLFGFLGTVVTGVASIAVAIIVNRREKHDSAESSADKLDEQWRAFKDDQINNLRADNAELRTKWADAEARADRLQRVIDTMRAEEKELTDER